VRLPPFLPVLCPPPPSPSLPLFPLFSFVLTPLSHVGENLHVPDGAAQRARDEALKLAATGTQSPDRWGDKSVQKRLFSYDPVKHAQQEFAKL
jgi:hypothetical protein